MSRFLLTLLAASCAWFFSVTSTSAFEQVNHFDADIVIQPDTSLAITEKIEYETDLVKHGIYRYLPYRYTRNGVRYSTHIDITSVTDENDAQIPFEETRDSQFVTLKIGEADITFTGEKNYVISYLVRTAIQEYSEYDELYWDITGEGWQFPILATTATIHSPAAKVTNATCFGGAVGGDDGGCRIVTQTDTLVGLAYATPVEYGDNVTVAVALDSNNQLVFPTATQNLLSQLQDNLNLLLFFIPPVLFGIWWWRKGRDRLFISANVFEADESQPQVTAPLLRWGRVPFVYEPLKELTPGEAGTILDERADNQDVIAELIELAHKKYLKIERTEKKKLLGSTVDYVLTKLKTSDAGLPSVQAFLFNGVFATGDSVKLSSLKGSFYEKMNTAKSMLYESLSQKKMFTQNPSTVKGISLVVALAMIIALVVWLFVVLEQGQWMAIPLIVISAPLTLIFANSLPAKTARGSNQALQAKGLRETIARGKWREVIKEKQLFIEAVLPFAISLGVVDRLVHDLEGLNLKPPRYLDSATLTQAYVFNSFMRDFNTQATSTLSYNPASSSRGSGSGFSGGSSGGGGGGGGGGSW